ncbi:MAG TPA: ROK family protein [Anaerolineae bacterium]|nr:ROK family protein [Anaerolineae bacterium]
MKVLGIDIGGSGIKGAVVDVNKGELVSERIRIATPEKSKPRDVAKTVNKIVMQSGWKGRIGCGFPAIIKDGVALSAANINKKWIGTDVDSLLSQKTGLKVYTLNDADAAGLAEMTFGAGKDYKDKIVVLLTLGTGIGSAVFMKGQLLPNTELGHFKIRGKDAEKRASDMVRKKKKLGWKNWSKRLQEYLDTLEYLVNPDVIIIGGGVSKNHAKFFPHLSTSAKLLPAQFLNQAGIIGAALYARRQ